MSRRPRCTRRAPRGLEYLALRVRQELKATSDLGRADRVAVRKILAHEGRSLFPKVSRSDSDCSALGESMAAGAQAMAGADGNERPAFSPDGALTDYRRPGVASMSAVTVEKMHASSSPTPWASHTVSIRDVAGDRAVTDSRRSGGGTRTCWRTPEVLWRRSWRGGGEEDLRRARVIGYDIKTFA